MESFAQNADPVPATPTGIQELDEVTMGGQAGDFIVIGARPSMGKTAFCQTIANHTLEKFQNLSIQFYSMEMPAEQIVQRFLAMRAQVSLQAIMLVLSTILFKFKVIHFMGYLSKNLNARKKHYQQDN